MSLSTVEKGRKMTSQVSNLVKRDSFAGLFFVLYRENKEVFNFINKLYEYHYVAFRRNDANYKMRAKTRLWEFLSLISSHYLNKSLKPSFEPLKFWQQNRQRLSVPENYTPYPDGVRFYSCLELDNQNYWFNQDYFNKLMKSGKEVPLPELPKLGELKPQVFKKDKPAVRLIKDKVSNAFIQECPVEKVEISFNQHNLLEEKFKETLQKVEDSMSPEDYVMWLLNVMSKAKQNDN